MDLAVYWNVTVLEGPVGCCGRKLSGFVGSASVAENVEVMWISAMKVSVIEAGTGPDVCGTSDVDFKGPFVNYVTFLGSRTPHRQTSVTLE